ncbi:hypothetical protein I4U23_003124 [Adineta vaga]|nr:hypothetical protein I4U23_003124 [Adineta vaga]
MFLILAITVNQPKLCPSATWNATAITFADNNTVGTYPYGIFINNNNIVYVANQQLSLVQVWFNDSSVPTTLTVRNNTYPVSLSATDDSTIYVDNNNYGVATWTFNQSTNISTLYTGGKCYDLFIDKNDSLYCSLRGYHQVIKRSLNSSDNQVTIVAGGSCSGFMGNLLNSPSGIFVDINYNLYVADYGNHRIQLFQSGNSNATTIAGAGAPGTIILNYPTDVIVDADDAITVTQETSTSSVNLVASSINTPVMSRQQNISCNQPKLYQNASWNPNATTLADARIVGLEPMNIFENFAYPNSLFVTATGAVFADSGYLLGQVKQWSLNATSSIPVMYVARSCYDIFIDINDTIYCSLTDYHEVVSKSLNEALDTVTIAAGTGCSGSASYMLAYPQGIFVDINFNIYVADTGNSRVQQFLPGKNQTKTMADDTTTDATTFDTTILEEETTASKAKTLTYGIYQLVLTVKMAAASHLSSSTSTFIKITPSAITANLIQFGTSMITRGYQQQFTLDPGSFSLDPDALTFDPTHWKYQYYCRIYNQYNFPNSAGNLLSIDDPQTDLLNPSCVQQRSGNASRLQYSGPSTSPMSALTLLSHALTSNQTYQFMVHLQNLRNSSSQATGYLLVQVEDSQPELIIIACVISTLCVPNQEYQMAHARSPHTMAQHPLFSPSRALNGKMMMTSKIIHSIVCWTTHPNERMILTFSSLPSIQLRLPTGNANTSFVLHISAEIRDTLSCVTEYNILQQSSGSGITNNPIVQILASGNPTIVGQVINSLSQQLNQLSSETVDNAVANGVPASNIAVSSLDDITTTTSQTLVSHIKLQASSLAQLTQATNQLTRSTSMIAAQKCHELAVTLHAMATKIPFEDVQSSATQIAQCASNVLNAINGPLQQRTTVLDLDSSRANSFPTDYDTDLESEWNNPNPFLLIPPMSLQNVTALNATTTSPHHQLFNLHFISITHSLTVSVHFEMQPLNITLAYLFIYRFDTSPILNTSHEQIDGWTLFCPHILTNDSTYTFFIDNHKTTDHRSIIFGLRQLNATEQTNACSNSSSLQQPPITDQPFNFTANYQLRIFTSGCYYLDANNNWQSNDVLVGSLTNHRQTQCLSTHLTTFAGGFLVLPAPINWNYVFANADFTRNKTIYITLICVTALYLLLLVYTRYKDKKDLEKLGVTPLPDNQQSDDYFYQILVFTGHRKHSGTSSKVHFIVAGDDDETQVRTFADPHRKILQRGGIDAFVMTVPKSLGSLNYIHIWHDNTGEGTSASWFLKYIIVRDLQTMDKSYFISQRWFAVEKDDGMIERVLPVAGEDQRREFSYVLSKQAYHSVSEGHLWFSIFSRPPSNRFTRVQRCTFAQAKANVNTDGLAFGPLHITPEQISIGIIVELLSFLPSILLVQFFRRIQSKRMHRQLPPLQQAIYKIKQRQQPMPLPDTNVEINTKKRSQVTFPWWCLFIAYALSLIIVGVSMFFIIVRGIEFGDLKTQKWLTSLLSGFFSSIFLIQPAKIIGLTIIFAFFIQNTDKDQEAAEFIDEDHPQLNNDEQYLHSLHNDSPFLHRSKTRPHRLHQTELAYIPDRRLKEIQMWSIIREIFTYFTFLAPLCHHLFQQ